MKFVQKELDSKVNVNVSRTNPVKEFFILLFGAIGVIIVVYFVLGLAVDMITAKKNPQLEKKLGTIFGAHMDSKSCEEVNKVFDSLLKNVEKDGLEYSVSVVNDDKTENAVIYPGRKIIIYSGLLKKIRSENELFFILAHEVGHAQNNDHIRSLGRGLVLILISTAVIGENNFISRLFTESMHKSDRIYSQNHERKADIYAINQVNKKYGHVSGTLDFFKRHVERDNKKLFVFSTHPSSISRIKALMEHIRKNGYKEGEKIDKTYK